MTAFEGKPRNAGPFVHLGLSFHLQEESTKFNYTFDDDASSLGSSVMSGLRNSLHSSFEFDKVSNYDLSSSSSSEEDDEFASDLYDNHEKLTWRQDPFESGSDWTMSIESVPDGTITEYHVHKRFLSKGLKKSCFFVSLFALSETNKLETTKNDYSSTKVHANAAQQIPQVLDFLYSNENELDIETQTAVALWHLSEFFGIRALAARTTQFIYDDINIENVRSYIQAANSFDDFQTLKLCADVCAENIDRIEPYSDILTEMDPSFFLDVISSQHLNRNDFSSHLSALLCSYCELRTDLVEGSVFEELTTVEFLPLVSHLYAIDLMIFEAQMVDEADDDSQPLTTLQKRCISALLPTISPQELLKDQSRKVSKQKLMALPPKVLLELLSLSIYLDS